MKIEKKQILLLLIVAIATFVDGFDGSMVSIILSSISNDFNVDIGLVSWVSTIYFLIVAGLLFPFGKLSDIGHIKKVFMLGLMVFTAGSLFCGISISFVMLMISRSIQAIGASMLASSALMLCVVYLPVKMLSFAVSMIVLGSASGFAAGPMIGGILTTAQSWHWTFLINVPIGIILTLAALHVIPKDKISPDKKFDIIGSFLLLASLTLGLSFLYIAPSSEISTLTIVAIVSFILTLVLFFMHCKRTQETIIDLALFKHRNLNAAITVCLFMNAVYMGLQYLIPFYSEKAFQFDSMTSGLYLSIPAIITLSLCVFIGKISDKLDERRFFILIGCSIMLAEMILMSMVKEDSCIWALVITLIFMGLQFGIAGGPVGARIIYNTPESLRNASAAITSFVTYFGSALGIAVFSAIFKLGAGKSLVASRDLNISNFMDGLHYAMFAGIIISLISLLLASTKDQN